MSAAAPWPAGPIVLRPSDAAGERGRAFALWLDELLRGGGDRPRHDIRCEPGVQSEARP